MSEPIYDNYRHGYVCPFCCKFYQAQRKADARRHVHEKHTTCKNCGHELAEDGGHFIRVHGKDNGKTCAANAAGFTRCGCVDPQPEAQKHGKKILD